MFVLTFYQDIYLSFLFLFRFCDVDDQLLLELLLTVGYLYLWIAFNAKKDMNYNKKTEGRRGVWTQATIKQCILFEIFL